MGKPTYRVHTWKSGEWWLARVIAASEDADPAPVDAVTHATSRARLDDLARDLIATILDADEDTFDAHLDHALPASPRGHAPR